jgi:protein TonB
MVLGADAPAGLAATPSESEAAATQQPSTEPEKTEPEKTEEPKPVEDAKAPEPEPTPEPPIEQVAMVPPEPVPEPPKEEPKQEPKPEIVDEAPERISAIPPEPPKPQPRPEIKPEVKPVAKPKPKAKAAPKQHTAARTSDDARPANTSAARSSSASGIGVGRSDLSTNYRGIVAAHLARHKQFPAEARASGHQGSTSVSFTIDGSGRVTSVRLGRGSGISSLDQETTAMVRRASPFPAPPTGQSMSFSVPVSFFLR